jgi:hypothetical protein
MIDALRMWSARRWRVAVLGGIATAILVALPTAVIPNPIFGRAIEVTWWSYPIVALTGILGGLLLATYVKEPGQPDRGGLADPPGQPDRGGLADPPGQREKPAEEAKASKLGIAGAFVAYFAVGCPVCNKLVLIALGTSGAMTWFAPVQPFLAAASVVLMAVALRIRLKNQNSCSVKTSRSAEQSLSGPA